MRSVGEGEHDQPFPGLAEIQGEHRLSRIHWVVLAALGLGVVLVFGCLGGYVLNYLTLTVPVQTPETVHAVDTPTPTYSPTPSLPQTPTPMLLTATPEPPTPTNTRVAPVSTPTATTAPTSTPTTVPTPPVSTGPTQGDLEYLARVQPILVDLRDMMAHVANLGMDSPHMSCTAWRSLGYTDAAEYLVMKSFSCPEPDSECLQKARLFLFAAVQDLLIAFETLDTFCATGDEGELYWAQDSMKGAAVAIELANESMDSCPWTQ